jgi:hypothetical protein
MGAWGRRSDWWAAMVQVVRGRGVGSVWAVLRCEFFVTELNNFVANRAKIRACEGLASVGSRLDLQI